MKAMTKVRALSVVIAIAGVACASTGNSSATPSQPERTSQVSSQAPSSPTTIDESAPGTIPAGQEVDVRLRSTLSSETATVEQRFETTTVVDLHRTVACLFLRAP
jgi:ABC-type transport system substrate-binding protein